MKQIKEEFPQTKHGIYLDSAATTLKLKKGVDALSKFYLEEYATINRSVYSLSIQASKKYNQTREAIANFIHASSPEEIVFTKNTTESINLVAKSFGSLFKQGDEIILSEMEHHSNLVPWQMLAKEKGLVLKFIPINDKGELILEQFESLLNDKTKLVAIAHIPNVTATINPIDTIIKLAHAYDAKVLIDGAQAIAHMRVDVQASDIDFYCFSAHKAYGPTGVGVLYGKKELLELMAPLYGGGDIIEEVYLDYSTYLNPPFRFEAGTTAIAEIIAFKESIDFLNKVGMDRIFDYENQLLSYLTDKISHIPKVKIIGTAEEKGGIVSFVIEGVHPLDLASFLNLKNIAIRTGHICAQPLMRRFNISSIARASIGIYNTIEDIDCFIRAVEEISLKFSSI